MQEENQMTWGNLCKQNQMHISARTKNQTWDSLVQSEGRLLHLPTSPPATILMNLSKHMQECSNCIIIIITSGIYIAHQYKYEQGASQNLKPLNTLQHKSISFWK